MIIERYLCREVLRTCAAVLAVLVLVYGSVRFTRFLADAAAGVVSPDLVFQILALTLAKELHVLLPLSLYLAVLISIGRLYRDSEIVAFGAGGVGIWRLSRGVLMVVSGFALVGAILSLFVSPNLALMREMLLEEAKQEADSRVFAPRRFKEFGGGDQVIYVEAIDSATGRMSDVFVRIRRPDRQYVLVSGAAYQYVRPDEGGRFMVLENGWRYAGLPGEAEFSVTRFERHAVRIDDTPKETFARGRKMLATMALIGSGDSRHVAELHHRMSAAVSMLVLGMLAVPLARASPREGRYAKLFVAIVVYFVYSNSLSIFEKFLERGTVPSFIGVWPVHAAVALTAVALVLGQTSFGWRLRAKLRPASRFRDEGAAS